MHIIRSTTAAFELQNPQDCTNESDPNTTHCLRIKRVAVPPRPLRENLTTARVNIDIDSQETKTATKKRYIELQEICRLEIKKMHEQKAKYSKSGISSTQHKQPANRPTIHATPNIIFIPGRGEIGNPFIDILSKKRDSNTLPCISREYTRQYAVAK